jgi:hypothetical protein
MITGWIDANFKLILLFYTITMMALVITAIRVWN